jgi:nitrogen-specific signal transduction histidine kinase
VRDWKQDREGIAITVADNGTGIDRRAMKRIFEPFFSTKGTTGTGLGLWVSREILAKHQGTIHVRSHVPRHDGGSGGWTVFRVFLPFSLEPEENAASSRDAAIAEQDEGSETTRDLATDLATDGETEGETEGAVP